jgi:hypothetical protein
MERISSQRCKVCHCIVHNECGTIESEDQNICDKCEHTKHTAAELVHALPPHTTIADSTSSPSSSPARKKPRHFDGFDPDSLRNTMNMDSSLPPDTITACPSITRDHEHGRNCCDLEMTPPDWVKEKYLGNVFEQNEVWRQSKLKIDPEYFTKLGSGHKPKYMWIGMHQDRHDGFLLHAYSLSHSPNSRTYRLFRRSRPCQRNHGRRRRIRLCGTKRCQFGR